ncbi:tRNA lysidine(34) synthetase TilS [Nonlabens xiamenensis]|uniref:tRNA lysidine(34) synthetase TilS n=1 Tax=Nonlabens xiamenensis TaxID=2341043 RepID=UPI000F61510B|nr:tRNA lysidine(34) synthetase TilS [Nonlabens xiamenensis]
MNDLATNIIREFPELSGARVAVAASGGLDSSVLIQLCSELGLSASILHVNFKLRGAESDADAQFLADWANRLGWPIQVREMDAANYATRHKCSIQMAARQLRYDWFSEWIASGKVDYVLTAHHLDDQLETLLINLGRGAGLKGLSGIPARNGHIRRPLLSWRKKDILAYAEKQNLHWREDSSNASQAYLRNKLRHQVLPQLHEILPELGLHLADSLAYLKQADLLVQREVDRFRESGTSKDQDGMHIALQKLKATRAAEAYLYELIKSYGFHIPDAVQLLDAQPGKRIFAGDWELIRGRDRLSLRHKVEVRALGQLIDKTAQEVSLAGKRISINEVKTQDPLQYVKSRQRDDRIFLDADLIQWPLELRTWQIGDRMQPFGMKGTKLVSDLLTDLKVSLIDKEKALVLTCENKILWLVGLRASKNFVITSKTKHILELNLEK